VVQELNLQGQPEIQPEIVAEANAAAHVSPSLPTTNMLTTTTVTHPDGTTVVASVTSTKWA
jgi:hypothetical protein